jgi:signal transduction histidine kinase
LKAPGYTQTLIAEKRSALWVDSYSGQTIPNEGFDILNRFARVFEQAYIRFLDLQKAEDQAREAKIESALERVRSRSMAMHKSEELLEAGEILFLEMQKLGIESLTAGYVLLDIEGKNGLNYTPHPGTKKIMSVPVIIPHNETIAMQQVVENWKKGISFFIVEMDEEETIKHQTFIAERSINFPLSAAQLIAISPPKLFLHNFYFKEGYVLIVGGTKLSAEQTDIMLRFAKVFQQTYTRFLDLQKAEAQAREAQVEVALERIRARALAMQSSTELNEVAKVLRDQMGILDQEDLEASVVHLYSADSPTFDSWYALRAGDKILEGQATFRLENSALAKEFLKLYEDDITEYTIEVKGQKLKEWLAEIKRNAPKIAAYWGDLPPEKQFYHFSDFSGGALLMVSHENPTEETRMLQKRCALVFELAYKRFLDLESKEKQERELLQEKLRLEQALSELKATQAQLIQAEKMASLGELTAGIAHEIQNPLNFVNNFSEVSAELVEEIQEARTKNQDKIDIELENEILEDIKQNLEKITLHGKRADAIVKGMLEHSKRGSGQKQETDINALADEFLRMTYQSILSKDANFKVELRTNLDPDLPRISVIPQDIGKVLLNLYSNAFYACATPQPPEGGGSKTPTVTLSTSTYTPLEGGRGVKISVKDNGSGIPQNIVDKIFQPFFTTKPTGSGTGLGLSLSYDIVKAHGGELKVVTEEGKGSEFIIQIPINTNIG